MEELQASLFVRNQHKTQKSSNYQNALQNLDGIEISTRVQVQLSQQSFLKLAPNQNQNFSAEVLPYQTSQETCYQPSIHLKEPDHQDSEHPLPSSCSYQDFSNNKKSAIALKRRHEILSRMKQQKSTNLPAFVKKPVVLPDKLRTAPKTSYSCSPLKPKVDSTYNGDLGRWKKKRQEFLEIQKSLEPTKLKKLYVVLEDALTTPAIHYQAVTSLAFVQNSSSWAIDIKCLRSCGFKRSFNKVKEMRKEMHKHFEVHKRDSRWNGFCSKCAKQVVERSVKRTLSMRDELEHVLDYHTK